jgi:histidinol-phosphate/aromatic aminotransferase/cobyric acid decarboxylase-like protein
VTVSAENMIRQFIPKQDFDGALVTSYYKTVNIYKFSRDYLVVDYLPFLKAYVKTMGSNEYYEEVLRVIATLEKHNLAAMPLQGEKWYEIDDLQDFGIAETLFAPPSEQYSSYLRRHGGYWRFPEIRDFCYLVNPYFPPTEMVQEMRRSFEPLLLAYPSAAAVQDHLAAKMLGCDPATIAVGNGAAELITAIGDELGAPRVGVPVPTFEEYLKRFPGSDVVEFTSQNIDLAHDVEHLRELADRTDALVLVNPDNPSGQCLTRTAVLELVDHLAAAGKHLILDESFVDFADPDVCSSLLTPGVLETHPRLVIVKSISKSYGVPGSRLGFVATADADLLRRLRARRSVWNINSVAESFLQIIGKYRAAYQQACQQIRTERDRFYDLLSSHTDVRVIPSQANYVMCELLGDVTASELSRQLLQDHAALVKDCTGKPGLDGRQFIRIAVRSSDDNDWIVKALTDSMEALG